MEPRFCCLLKIVLKILISHRTTCFVLFVCLLARFSLDREGSTSPISRKRKRVRRRSVDTNNAAATIDNHDQMSNSSSQSATQQAQPITSTPLTLSQITTATSAANVLNVTKKTDNNSNGKPSLELWTLENSKIQISIN